MDSSQETRQVDEKILKELHDFVRATVTLRQASLLYGKKNVTFKEAAERWNEISEKVFETSEIIELTVAGRNLFVGDILLDRDSPYVRELSETMRRLVVRRISIKRGLDEEELFALIDMLSLETRALLIKGGPVMYLDERGIKNIQIVENIYMKRRDMLKKLDGEAEGISADDLRFVSKQLKSFIALSKEGLELRNQERELLAEVGQHPTFMGELVKEISSGEAGEVAAADRAAQSEKISETLEILFDEMSHVPGYGEEFLGEAFSGALAELDEPMRLEVLAAQFRTAGQLPPILGEEVYDCSIDNISEFILNVFQRSESELRGLSPMVRHLIPDRSVYRRLMTTLEAACEERGVELKELGELLRDTLGEKIGAGGRGKARSRKEPAGGLRDCLEKLAALKKIQVDRSAFVGFLLSGDEDEGELDVLAEMLRSESASARLVARAAERVARSVRIGEYDHAHRILASLLELSASRNESLAKAAKREIKGLHEKGSLRGLLRAPIDGAVKAKLLVDMLRLMPRDEVAMIWEGLLSDGDSRVHDALAEAGSRCGKEMAEIFRLELARGRSDVVSRSADILAALPGEYAVPILKGLCQHPEPAVRLKAVALLGKTGEKRAIPVLLEMLGDTEGEVRRTAIALLGHLANEEVVERLMEIVRDESGTRGTEERTIACRALSRCGDLRAVPILARIARGERRRRESREMQALRASARFALGAIGGPEAERALAHGEARVRRGLWRLFRRKG